MSEVIEAYIRRHPATSERESFEGFLGEERIKAWIGTDPSRKERLRAEFGRVWGALQASESMTHPSARAGPSGPHIQATRMLRVEVQPERPAKAPGEPSGQPARKLQVMCTNCGRVDVWMHDHQIGCNSCGHVYEDMLHLIRVTPVGPFEFLFGGGWVGYATGAGIAGGLVLLYYLLRGF